MEPMTSMWKISVKNERTGEEASFMVQGDNRSRAIDNAIEKMREHLNDPSAQISFEEPEYAFDIPWSSLK